ncbi:hypothetical protein ABW20_dc0100253 [Dactylellina cionopaga]|nr:hypothetical protein ABW20_dc0100253 [Dactylellina cionopaga]
MILALPIELQSQILFSLPLVDQISASKVCVTWRELIVDSKLFFRSRYSTSNVMRGVHLIICTESQCFNCVVKSEFERQYFFSGNPLLDCSFLDEPLIAPWAWDDRALKKRMENLEVDLFTAVPGIYRRTWNGMEPFGESITVREFVENMIRPIFEVAKATNAPQNPRAGLSGSLTFFVGVQVLAAAFTLNS